MDIQKIMDLVKEIKSDTTNVIFTTKEVEEALKTLYHDTKRDAEKAPMGTLDATGIRVVSDEHITKNVFIQADRGFIQRIGLGKPFEPTPPNLSYKNYG